LRKVRQLSPILNWDITRSRCRCSGALIATSWGLLKQPDKHQSATQSGCRSMSELGRRWNICGPHPVGTRLAPVITPRARSNSAIHRTADADESGPRVDNTRSAR
jgi:hypothetical protein